MGWADRARRSGMHKGNGHDKPKGVDFQAQQSACGCGWRSNSFPTSHETLQALVNHAATAHGLVWRPEVSPWNIGFARQACKRMLERAQSLQQKMSGSPIAGPDGRVGSEIDLSTEMVQYIRDSSLAICAALDLALEAHTGEHVLSPPPTAEPSGQEKPDGAAS